MGGDENGGYAERPGDGARVLPGGSAETDKSVAPDILSLCHRDLLDGAAHLLVRNTDGPQRDIFDGQGNLDAPVDFFGERGKRGAGRLDVKRRVPSGPEASGEKRRYDPPQNDVGVGDGGRSAEPVARRPGS